jgi:uncharacterized membrane protein (DUF373 family)
MTDKEQKPIERGPFFRKMTGFLNFLDDLILVIVALGIIGMAVLLLAEALGDFLLYRSTHTVVHILGELMFVLIIMELFRQVFRQITRHVFSLNPFIFIGFIASIRGMLLTQMKMAMGEAEWQEGVVMISVHAITLLLLIACYYFYGKSNKDSEA